MMLLDAGNTRLKWAIHDGHGLTSQGDVMHRGLDAAGLAGRLWTELEPPDSLFVACVAGREVQDAITNWAAEHWNLQPVFIRVTAAAAGVANGYAVPEQLGVDRWAAMVGAWHEHKTAVIVIDCGTAITIDYVDTDGRHHGGLIAAGISMMRHSLLEGTARIDILPADQAQFTCLLSDATSAAIINGTTCMAAAMIDRVASEITARSGNRVVAVITGGDAQHIRPLLDCQTIHDPDLVLKGVAILAEEQT